MKAVLRNRNKTLLVPSIIFLLFLICTDCESNSQQLKSVNNKCIDLNFQAAAIQGSDACKLINVIIDDGDDLFAADVYDVETSCKDGMNSGYSLENDCVDRVLEVATRIDEEGCEITGGITVSNFVLKVKQSYEVFSLLMELACKRSEGASCYSTIQGAVEYCYQQIENCLGRVQCDCVLDFIYLVDQVKIDSAAVMETYTKLDDSVISIIKGSESSCRCKVLKSTLQENPSCLLFSTIIEEGDILAGSNSTLENTCDATNKNTCIDDILPIVANGLIVEECPLTSANNTSFITSLDGTSNIMSAISDLACHDDDCYYALQNCQKNDTLCAENIVSCDCIMNFMSIVDNLSPSSTSDILKVNDTTLSVLQESFNRCKCNELNAKAAELQNETYCSLYDSIFRYGSIFYGDVNETQSTCAQRTACINNVTYVVDRMNNVSGCDIQQESDDIAELLYVLHNSRIDFETMTDFVCGQEDCYNNAKDEVTRCRELGLLKECSKTSLASVCYDAFLDMSNKLSEDSKKKFIDTDMTILNRIKEPDKLRSGDNQKFFQVTALANTILAYFAYTTYFA